MTPVGKVSLLIALVGLSSILLHVLIKSQLTFYIASSVFLTSVVSLIIIANVTKDKIFGKK